MSHQLQRFKGVVISLPQAGRRIVIQDGTIRVDGPKSKGNRLINFTMLSYNMATPPGVLEVGRRVTFEKSASNPRKAIQIVVEPVPGGHDSTPKPTTGQVGGIKPGAPGNPLRGIIVSMYRVVIKEGVREVVYGAEIQATSETHAGETYPFSKISCAEANKVADRVGDKKVDIGTPVWFTIYTLGQKQSAINIMPHHLSLTPLETEILGTLVTKERRMRGIITKRAGRVTVHGARREGPGEIRVLRGARVGETIKVSRLAQTTAGGKALKVDTHVSFTLSKGYAQNIEPISKQELPSDLPRAKR